MQWRQKLYNKVKNKNGLKNVKEECFYVIEYIVMLLLEWRWRWRLRILEVIIRR